MKKKDRKKLNDKEDIRGKYHKICQHFGLPFDYASDKTPQSVNIIFNIHTKPPMIIVMATRNNEFKCRRVSMTANFTRIQR